MIPTLLVILFLVQFLLAELPGNGATAFSAYGYDDALEHFLLKHDMGDGLLPQYLRYVYNLFIHGEFTGGDAKGAQFIYNISIRIGYTVRLTCLGLLATVLIGVPLGVVSAVHKNGPADKVISAITLVLSSIPSYCLSLFLILLFALVLKILPPFGADSASGYVMPTAVLAIGGIALMARITRSTVTEVLEQQYITTLRAKGLGRWNIIVHILKNSMVPIIATLNNVVAQMFCSTLIAENLFSIPGLGAFLIEAVLLRSVLSVLCCVTIIATILMLISVVSEVLYLVVNPKERQLVRSGGKRRRKKKGGQDDVR